MTLKRKQSDTVLAARASKKADTTRDCFRNRLYLCFGSLINTISGALPSADKGLVSLILRTYVKLKHGNASLKERTRVVTVGLSTVLNDDTQSDTVLEKLKAASDYMSQCRVNASLLANYIMINLFHKNQEFPERNKAFFDDCLKMCGGSKSCSSDLVREHFGRFCTETNFTPQQLQPGICQVRVYEAERMATAASTFMEYHCSDRLKSIIKWHLRRNLTANGQSTKKYVESINQLCDFITSEIDEMDIMEAVHNKMVELRLNPEQAKLIEQMICLVTDEGADQLNLMLTMQELFLTEDRRRYESVCRQAFIMFQGKDEINANKRGAYIKQNWKLDVPPKCMAALPFCNSKATFITVDKKAMQELCKFKFDQVKVQLLLQFQFSIS